MSKQDTWDALKYPADRTCNTCFYYPDDLDDRCDTCSWILITDVTEKDCDFDGWKWDGKK